jgi:hypothetical protein
MRKASFLIVGFLIAGIAVYLWSGAYNVAAVEPHWGGFRFFLEEIRDRFITAHSRGINPPCIEDQKLVETGFPHFHEMRRLCHGAPGCPPTEFAQGLIQPLQTLNYLPHSKNGIMPNSSGSSKMASK